MNRRAPLQGRLGRAGTPKGVPYDRSRNFELAGLTTSAQWRTHVRTVRTSGFDQRKDCGRLSGRLPEKPDTAEPRRGVLVHDTQVRKKARKIGGRTE